MKQNSQQFAETAKAGLARFFDEGYTKWPEDKLRVIFANRDLNDPDVQSLLSNWLALGIVELPRRADCYLIMRKAFAS